MLLILEAFNISDYAIIVKLGEKVKMVLSNSESFHSANNLQFKLSREWIQGFFVFIFSGFYRLRYLS